MRLNYTKRLLLAFGIYTFFFMLVMFVASWVLIENIDSMEDDEIRDMASDLEVLMLSSEHQSRPIVTPDFEIYLFPNTPPAPYDQLVDQGVHHFKDRAPAYRGSHPRSEQPYYIIFKRPELEFDIESGIHDFFEVLMLVTIATLIAIMGMILVARRLAAPVLQLKHLVETIPIDSEQLPDIERDDEVGELSHAFSAMLKRVRHFIRREQEFTRFASHELRSPVMVLRGNLDLLEGTLPDSPLNTRIYTRMNAAVRRMALLIDSFLWLGREHQADGMAPRHIDRYRLNEYIDELKLGFSDHERQRITFTPGNPDWHLRPNMLSIVTDNLIRNALRHSSHHVDVIVNQQGMVVMNRLDAETDASQCGIGLQIVRRICDAEGWQLLINKERNSFEVSIIFTPAARTTAPAFALD